MCFDHLIIRHQLYKITRSSHSNVPQPQPTLKAKIDERSQKKKGILKDIEDTLRHWICSVAGALPQSIQGTPKN